jgi:hypothetical protein
MLHFDPQENVLLPFSNNLNTRIIEKDRFVPQSNIPGLSDDTYFTVHPSNMNPEAQERSSQLEGMVGGRRINERGLGDGFPPMNGIQDVGDIRQFSGTNTLFS